jgi:hypothetical protein
MNKQKLIKSAAIGLLCAGLGYFAGSNDSEALVQLLNAILQACLAGG